MQRIASECAVQLDTFALSDAVPNAAIAKASNRYLIPLAEAV